MERRLASGTPGRDNGGKGGGGGPKDGKKGICFHARDYGSCKNEKDCIYDHDKANLTKARAEKKARDGGGAGPEIAAAAEGHPPKKDKGKGKGKGKEKDGKKGKDKKKGEGGKGGSPGVCWNWQQGNCTRENCRFAHSDPAAVLTGEEPPVGIESYLVNPFDSTNVIESQVLSTTSMESKRVGSDRTTKWLAGLPAVPIPKKLTRLSELPD